jgi:sporulation protein YlmC with PRC-barrel domain
MNPTSFSVQRSLLSVSLSAAMVLSAALLCTSPAGAQVAGASTTMTASISESTQVALGWSVKKTLLGKNIYNEAGTRIGRIEDLIISPDQNVSYVIVGAGGFIGIGRHDVAVPVMQIKNESGRLILPGATKDTLKALPAFEYANDTARREQFIAAADKDIANAKTKITELEQKTASAASDARAKLDLRLTALRLDVKTSEEKLNELKQAAKGRWREFEAGVSAATTRLRKSMADA